MAGEKPGRGLGGKVEETPTNPGWRPRLGPKKNKARDRFRRETRRLVGAARKMQPRKKKKKTPK